MAADTRDRWEEQARPVAEAIADLPACTEQDHKGHCEWCADCWTPHIAAALRAAYEQGRNDARAELGKTLLAYMGEPLR